MKELVYIETTIVSYLTSRKSRDIVVAAHQAITQRWWHERITKYELVISELVIREASVGDPDAAASRLETLKDVGILSLSEEAISLAEILVSRGPIPRQYVEDALHIAVAALNGVDYLLTWNCKHLANAAHRSRIESLVEKAGYGCPIICTPEELMED